MIYDDKEFEAVKQILKYNDRDDLFYFIEEAETCYELSNFKMSCAELLMAMRDKNHRCSVRMCKAVIDSVNAYRDRGDI